MPIALQRAERADSCRARSVTERMVDIETGERTGSRPSAAEGGGAPAPALRPADPRSSSSAQLLSPQAGRGEDLSPTRNEGRSRPWNPPMHRIDRDSAVALIEPLTELVAQAGAAILAVNRGSMTVDGKAYG